MTTGALSCAASALPIITALNKTIISITRKNISLRIINPLHNNNFAYRRLSLPFGSRLYVHCTQFEFGLMHGA
jgi:hypothetical protein